MLKRKEQGFSKRAIIDNQGATSSKGARGRAMSSKEATGGHEVII